MDDQVINIPLDGDTGEHDHAEVDPDVLVVPEKDTEEDKLPPHAKEQEDGRVILPIKRPVTLQVKEGTGAVREIVYDSFTFKRLSGADMRAIMNGGPNSTTIAIARSTGVRQMIFDKVFDKMDAADVASCAQVISYFLGNG